VKVCSFEVSGVRKEGVLEDGRIVDASVFKGSLLREAMSSPGKVREKLGGAPRVPFRYDYLRRPFTPAEVWGAGITYLRSRDAREVETESKGIYDKVYSAVRPEIFFKDTGSRTVGPGEAVCVRSDSDWTVPEPELTVVLREDGAICGYTIGNDMSARDIEGANPLYIPQSKIYRNSCAIGPVVTTREEIPDPRSLGIEMKIFRDGKVAFEGQVSTSRLKRTVDELVDYLRKDNQLFGWTALLTGTGIVPPDDFSLKGGEVVEIEIEKIGTLRNTVTKLGPGVS
jgi:2-dehydro-3-deoxy-D-arabinonate dehydratase